MNEIPFLDLKAGYLELREEIDLAVCKSLNSGWYIGGESVVRFESEFAQYTGATHCVSMGNGLDALHLGLRALEVGPGDEVIVPSHTFIATWMAVSQVGATIVPVEPDEKNYTIDPKRIEKAITNKTKVIIPVHLYGHPADLDPILEIASSHGIKVLEDAAQAHGARYKGRRIGAHGDLVAWSFYPGKNLGAFGDAGAITTKNSDLAEKIKKLRNYGSSQKYQHELIGYNSRLDPIQAEVLSVKLRHLDEWNQRRKQIATYYNSVLEEQDIELTQIATWADPVWHLYVIRVQCRDELQQELKNIGVNTVIHYPLAPHQQGAYIRNIKRDLPIAEKLAKEVISLPIGPHHKLINAKITADKTKEICRRIINYRNAKFKI
jgi:dTDP-4-amino-4,6-dideoxygalactose transaminase